MVQCAIMRNTLHSRPAWVLAALLALLPTLALANIPIFFVFAGVRVTLWWTILLAIAVEAVALRYFFSLTWRQAAWAAVLVNIGTALLGFVVYPIVGTLSYPLLAPVVTQTFGTGEVVEIAAYCIAAAVIDTPIELALLAGLSTAAGYGIKVGWKAAAVFFVANLISAAVLFAAIQIGPRHRSVDAQTQDLLQTRFAQEVAFARGIFDELPRHIDAEGKVDASWRADLEQQVEGLNFLELMIGTSKAQYPVVAMPLGGVGSGATYSYGKDRYDGEAKVTPGTLERYGNADPSQNGTLEVLHYQLWNETADPRYSVRAILPLSGQD